MPKSDCSQQNVLETSQQIFWRQYSENEKKPLWVSIQNSAQALERRQRKQMKQRNKRSNKERRLERKKNKKWGKRKKKQ